MLLLLEHTPVITLGRRARKENLLLPVQEYRTRGIEVVQVERGGDVTFHGPGQVVGYIISRVRDVAVDVSSFVKSIGVLLERVTRSFGVPASFDSQYPGLWVRDPPRKIAAIGLSIKRGVSMHGFALNVNNDLSYFDLIVPCGLSGYGVTSLAKEGSTASINKVKQEIVKAFSKTFNVNMVEKQFSEVLD